jgi:5-methyltetrahydrofolate--homocysteine methyltransferase
VIDIGVMVPAEKIIQTALEEKVDVIGLSGLITPSLDEMVHMAKEMERAGLSIPLLIGGATTSKVHTAVKIDQFYNSGQAVHVLDASRSVTVVESLLGTKKEAFIANLKEEYSRLREHHEKHRASKELLQLSDARANKAVLDFSETNMAIPKKLGAHQLDVALEHLVPYIDWTPFFQTWELHGKFPAILTDEIVGAEASALFKDAQKMLGEMVQDSWVKAKAIFGLFPANSIGDDIEITDNTGRVFTQCTLRQQTKKTTGQANIALSDFIAPKESNQQDYIGAFVVTTGIGLDEHVDRFERDHDDYSSIMVKALADRLAEALAEYLHHLVRTEYWGYENMDSFTKDELIQEKYRGIRPAPGYPACPDHLEKLTIFNLLNATNEIGVSLTESLAMTPASSVSGWYFAHPDAKYFGLGKITEEQVQNIATRKGESYDSIARWYSSVLV